MSTLSRIDITSALTTNGFKSVFDMSPGGLPALQNIDNFIVGLAGGNQAAGLRVLVGNVAATATITSTGAATAAQTMTLLNVTLTARASAPAANEFVLSATPATQAANIAAAINASTSFASKVVATAALGVVTLTAVVPGVMSNGLQIAVGTLTNVTVAAFTGGANGTTTVLNFS